MPNTAGSLLATSRCKNRFLREAPIRDNLSRLEYPFEGLIFYAWVGFRASCLPIWSRLLAMTPNPTHRCIPSIP